MRGICSALLILFTMTMCNATPKGQKVLIETSLGDIKVVLYDDTPLHRANFIKHINSNYYNDLTFHRVIKGFMIQGGDVSGGNDTIFDESDLIESEFKTPKYFHKSGALAAARWGNDENPEKKSDPAQFYIVTGKMIFEHDIKKLEKERFEDLKQNIFQQMQSESMDTIKSMYREGRKAELAEFRASIIENSEKAAEERKAETLFTNEQKEVYLSKGGTPHLDGEYTVFGEVYEGLDIVKKISEVETNTKDKPLQTVIIKKISLIE